MRRTLRLIPLALLLLLLPLAAEEQAIEVMGLTWKSPLVVSDPIKVGLDAYSVLYPADSQVGQELLELMVHRVSPDILKQIKGSGADPLANARGIYLGLFKDPPEHPQQTILGHKVTGDLYPKALGGLRVECYWVDLSDGGGVFLALRTNPDFNPEQRQQFLAMVCQTLRASSKP